jgi:hypothetical protein
MYQKQKRLAIIEGTFEKAYLAETKTVTPLTDDSGQKKRG